MQDNTASKMQFKGNSCHHLYCHTCSTDDKGCQVETKRIQI